MPKAKHLVVALGLSASSLLAGACGGGGSRSNAATAGGDVATPSTSSSAAMTPTPAPDTVARSGHHSKLAGAAVGAVAGHMLGGHAVAGAAAGALIQHERNKHR